MSERQSIPANQLPTILEGISGHKYAVICTRTNPKITVKHRVTKLSLDESYTKPEGRTIVGIVKEKEAIYSINADYENMVNNRLEKEGFERNFETSSLPWGEYVGDSKILIMHKGEYYVRIYELQNNKLSESVKESVLFKVLDNGIELEFAGKELKDVYENFMPKEKEKKPLVEGGTFDGAKPIVNTVKASSIVFIRINGIEYNVK